MNIAQTGWEGMELVDLTQKRQMVCRGQGNDPEEPLLSQGGLLHHTLARQLPAVNCQIRYGIIRFNWSQHIHQQYVK